MSKCAGEDRGAGTVAPVLLVAPGWGFYELLWDRHDGIAVAIFVIWCIWATIVVAGTVIC